MSRMAVPRWATAALINGTTCSIGAKTEPQKSTRVSATAHGSMGWKCDEHFF